MKKKFAVEFDSPYVPKIESLDTLRDDSLFLESYEQACRLIREIINSQDLSSNSDNDKIYNIIPLLGDRGTGKTSVMMSLLKYLSSYNPKQRPQRETLWLGDVEFITLKKIDAGHLLENENLFGVVLARMLAYYNDMVEHIHKPEMRHKGVELMQTFCKIYKDLMNPLSMNRDKDIYDIDALQELEKMDASHNIKKSFTDLVEIFTETLGELNNSRMEKHYVVIAVDDVDMNMRSAYAIMEQMQSYMMIPNVIILFTSSYDNLINICINNYSDTFRELIHAASRAKTGLDERFLESCEELAHEYLNKFLPTSRIIDLKQKKVFELCVRIKSGYLTLPEYEKKKGGFFLLEESSKEERLFKTTDEEMYSYELVMNSIILRGTGIYIYMRNDKGGFLIPESIRSKVQYFQAMKMLHPLLQEEKYSNTDFKNFSESIKERANIYLNNFNILMDDISVRQAGSFPEMQRQKIKTIIDSELCDLSITIYRLTMKIHEPYMQIDDEVLPLAYNKGVRNHYLLSHVVDILDSLEKRSGSISYKPFINTALIIAVIKLESELYNEILSYYEEKCKQDQLPQQDQSEQEYIRLKAQTEYDLAIKHIGSSLFGWFDKQLVRPIAMSGDISPTYVEEDISNNALYIGFQQNVGLNITQWFDNQANGFMDSNGQLDFDKVHAAAIFFMFLNASNNDYKIEYHQGEKNFTFNFIGKTEFAASAFFVNICKPINALKIYFKMLEAVDGKNINLEKEIKNCLCSLNAKHNLLNDFNIETDTETKTIMAEYASCSKFCNEGIVPMLNIEFMYSIVREIRKSIKKNVRVVTPWDSYCEYFESIGNALMETDNRYKYTIISSENEFKNVSNTEENQKNHHGRLFSKYIGKVPTNDETQKDSYFFLNENEQKYFNQMISTINWDRRILQPVEKEKGAGHAKNDRDSENDIQKQQYK